LHNRSQTSGDNLNNVRRESSGIFREKKEGISERKELMSLKQTVRTKISETCTEA
jgi:hypothetical protein